MGFYQVEPGSGQYWFGTPLFDKVSINVGKAGENKTHDGKLLIKGRCAELRHRNALPAAVRFSQSGNKYIVQKLLGAGGQGEVYAVTLGSETYALKWYFKHTATITQTRFNALISTLLEM